MTENADDIQFGVNEELFVKNGENNKLTSFFEQFILSIGDLVSEYQCKSGSDCSSFLEKELDAEFLLKEGDLITCRDGKFSASTPINSISSVIKFAVTAALTSNDKKLFVKCPDCHKAAFMEATEASGVQVVFVAQPAIQEQAESGNAELLQSSMTDADDNISSVDVLMADGEQLSPFSASEDAASELPPSVRISKKTF